MEAESVRTIEYPTAAWGELIPDEEWEVYRRAIRAWHGRGIPVVLGGAFALASYTGRWRNTKDIDLYVVPSRREEAVALLGDLGFSDYYDVLPYDRRWIYRAHQEDVIVDVIFSFANQVADVDERWTTAGPRMLLRGEEVSVIPAEELVWAKLYIVQRERCDWPDVLNVIYASGSSFDWRHLIDRLGPDLPLLSGVLSTYSWLCPGEANALPRWLWKAVGLRTPAKGPAVERGRVRLLDSRPWFGEKEGK